MKIAVEVETDLQTFDDLLENKQFQRRSAVMNEETAAIFAEVLHKPAFAPVMSLTFRLCFLIGLLTIWKLTMVTMLSFMLINDASSANWKNSMVAIIAISVNSVGTHMIELTLFIFMIYFLNPVRDFDEGLKLYADLRKLQMKEVLRMTYAHKNNGVGNKEASTSPKTPRPSPVTPPKG